MPEFYSMSIHIGKIIYKLKEQKGLKNKIVADAISIAPSSIYKIYKKESIDIFKMIELSKLFKVNLFEYYVNEDPIKNLIDEKIKKLTDELERLKEELIIKDERIWSYKSIFEEQKSANSALRNEIEKLKKQIAEIKH